MSPDWRFVVHVEDVSGNPLVDVQLTVTVWTGGGSTQKRPTVAVTGQADVVVPAAAQSVTLDMRHARYAPLALAMVRGPGESVWRWTDPNRIVRTTGTDVDVFATMSRLRPAPTVFVPEDEVIRRAEAAFPRLQEAVEKAKRANRRSRRKSVPQFVIADNTLRGALVTGDRSAYRSDWVSRGTLGNNGRVLAFHLPRAEMLGPDPTKPAWDKFSTTTVDVDPVRDGRLHIVEYGEVGDDAAAGPRFALALWVPAATEARANRKLDMIVWLHPDTTNPLVTPQVEWPFGPPYPYGLLVNDVNGHAAPSQKFIDILCFHLASQHLLAYHMIAARKQAVIVMPVVPSSHFEVFEAPASLMRLLKEVARWIPRDFQRGTEAQVHPPPPEVGNVVVGGFSASVPRLATIMRQRVAGGHYAEAIWGTRSDAVAFEDHWKEQWSIDCVRRGFTDHLNLAAQWVGAGSGRRIRIYKSDFTSGRWLPAAAGPGAWAALVRGVEPVTRESGKSLFAQTLTDPGGRWQAVSMSEEFALGPATGPGAAQQPVLRASGAHEMMPRICFGHAVVTSGLVNI